MNSSVADLVLHNGFIVTMDSLMPKAKAFAVKDGQIAFIGDDTEVVSWIGKNTQVIDLRGSYVYPGFIDTHMHVLFTGITSNYLQLKDCQSKEAILQVVKKQALTCKKGEWIVGIGWDDQLWGKSSKLTRLDLDTLTPDNPVVLVRSDTHLICVNSYALKLANIDDNTPDPKGGQIGRDHEGKPNGILIDRAMSLVKDKMPGVSVQESKQIIKEVLKGCLEKGLTTVYNAATDETEFEAFKHLAEENALHARVYMMGTIRNNQIHEFIQQGPKFYGDFLRLQCVKLWIDGAMGSRGAALLQPYNDDLANEGLLLWDVEELQAILEEVKSIGFQVAIHAIGDKGNRRVLDAYEKVGVNGLRWRIEHAQQLSPSDIHRFAELGVIAAMQPLHMIADMNWVEERLGKERAKAGAFVWKSLLEKGATIVGGSDAPVVDFNPLWGIYAAITRQDFDQLPREGWYPEQCLSRYEALKMYTIDAAYACFSEDKIGSLTVGKFADFVVLPENLLTCPPKALLDMKVLYTFVDGKMRYGCEGSEDS